MKRTRTSHVRMKVVALLAALAALWSFAAYVTVREGLNILFVSTVGEFGVTTAEVVGALQVERRLSVVAASGGDRAVGEELTVARAYTDQLVVGWQGEAATRRLQIAAGGDLLARVDAADAALRQLPELRAEVDDGTADRSTARADFTSMIATAYEIYGAMSSLYNQDIARQSQSLIALSHARELLSQEDALLVGVLTADQATAQDIADFTQLVGAQRFMYERTAAELHPDDQALLEAAVAGPAVVDLRALEDKFIQDARPGSGLPFNAELWRSTVESAEEAFLTVELAGTDNLVQRSTPVAMGVIVRLVLAGGLGLIALIAAIIISITTARSLVRQLERLRDAARELAENKLPAVVTRLSGGEKVNVAAEAPPLRFGDDEIGQVGQAFNAVQETAVRAAVQQAELRRGVRDVFLSLARRTQNLVHKQLGVLDGMERRETDADEMAELYRVDHLATRMRRNAENLIVLSGASPGRTWRRPVAMIDVVRGAIGEVEDYTRVTLLPVDAGSLAGRAVGDVIHLLAELIENAASFSPPYARVTVAGQRVAHGFVVEVEDRGLGMSDEELVTANAKLADPPDFSLADASRLGLYVVAKLSQRHGVRVHLRTSPYGGVVAIVLVPNELLTPAEDDQAAVAGGTPAPAAESPAAQGSARREPRHGLPGTDSGPPDHLPAPVAGSAPVTGSRPAETTADPREAASADPPPVEPAGPETEEEQSSRTPSGLPWRVRQASLPRQLSNGHGTDPPTRAVARPAAPELPSPRDPEQVRRMMRSYQHGTQRGRNEASPGPDSPTTPDQEG